MRYAFAFCLAMLAGSHVQAQVSTKISAPHVVAGALPQPSTPTQAKLSPLTSKAGRVTAQPDAPRTIQVRATSYSWRERDHRYTYGRHNCMGGLLTELVEGCQQCAADTGVFPLGTILEVPGAGRRIVTDRGSAVEGGHHIDLHFDSLEEMMEWGTQRVGVRVIRLGWDKDGPAI